MRQSDDVCRVCGYRDGEYFWRDGHATWHICDRCWCESGNEDFTPKSAFRARVIWLASDAAKQVPADALARDLAAIDPEYLKYVDGPTRTVWSRLRRWLSGPAVRK